MEISRAVKLVFKGLEMPQEFDAELRRNLLSAFEEETWLSMAAGGNNVAGTDKILDECFFGGEIAPKP
ncbi:hypothetical protein FACS189499_09020 [Clostridia bacterium]|nr:hypothetical protein FACS189499_09020 [Clostridia bacterium]